MKNMWKKKDLLKVHSITGEYVQKIEINKDIIQ